MYAQLGNIIFEGVKSLGKFESNRESNLVEMAKLENKPNLQRVAGKLETVRLDMQLHVSFANVQFELNRIEDAREAAEILPMFNGNGNFLGTFVIKKVKREIVEAADNGAPILARVQLDLLEYFDPTPEATARNAAIAEGFANEQNAPQEVNAENLAHTPEAEALNNVNAVSADAGAVDGNIVEAVAIADTRPSNFADSVRRLDRMAGNVQNTLVTINNSGQDIFNATRNMESALINVQSAVSSLRVISQVQDVNSALGANNTLQLAIAALRSSSAELVNFGVAR